nr:hypothetical protein BaRGS_005848 [Batillaria attramentaria]
MATSWEGQLELIVYGLLGLVGVVVYAATRKQKSHTFDTLSVELGFRLPDRGSAYDYNWGLYLAGVGSGVAVIAAILIAVFNEDDENISDLDIDNKSDYSSHSGGNPRHVGYPRRWEGYPRSEDGDESFSRYSNKGFSRHEYDDRKRRDYDRGSRADSDDVILGRHHDEGRRQDKRDYKHRDYSRDSADISRHDDDMRHGRREGKYRDDRDRSRDSDDFSRNDYKQCHDVLGF